MTNYKAVHVCGNLRCVGIAWQLLGMLGNVLGLLGMLGNVLGMLCNVLGMLGNVLGLLGMPFRKVLGVLHRRKTPPTCCLISCEVKGVVYHQASIYGSVHTIFVKDKSHDNEIV